MKKPVASADALVTIRLDCNCRAVQNKIIWNAAIDMPHIEASFHIKGMTDHEIFKYWMLLKQTKHELTTATRITVDVKILS